MNKNRYINNREQLSTVLPNEVQLIVIAGNGLVSRVADTTFPFRQDSNVLYFSGLATPNSALMIERCSGNTYIVQELPSSIEQIFDDTVNVEEACKTTGANRVISPHEALKILKKYTAKQVYSIHPGPKRQHGYFINPYKHVWHNRLKRLYGTYGDALPYISQLRMIKQPYELQSIQKAIQITMQSLDKVMSGEILHKSEIDVAQEVSIEFMRSSATHAYQPIVALSSNAAVLHHEPSYEVVRDNTTVLFDIGAEVNGYAADISRTFVVGKDKRAVKLIEDVANVQKELIAMLRPGVTWKQCHGKAVDLLQTVARSHPHYFNEPIDQLFPHAIGHFLGLDVHDIGDYSVPLQEGMVITIEPGLYSKKSGIGVRIEDDILITKDGAQKL